MYEFIKLNNAFSGKNKNEIKKEIKNILISKSYQKIEETSLKEEKGIIGTMFVCLLFLFIDF
jgi:hypothetical protein